LTIFHLAECRISAEMDELPQSLDQRQTAMPSGRGQAANTRRRLVMAGATIAIVAALAIFVVNIARGRSERMKCQKNLLALGQAMALYASDHNGRYPDSFAQLLEECVYAPEVFVCPVSSDRPATGTTMQEKLVDFAKPGRCSYVYLGAGRSSKAMKPDFVLAYERLDNHHDGAHFLFGDATVRWLDALESRKLVSQIESGYGPKP
jgi:hypothetical protein